MRKLKMAVLILTTILAVSVPFTVFAEPAESNVTDNSRYASEVIETKFRIYNGVLQYRRWNATRGVWVDPYWINAD